MGKFKITCILFIIMVSLMTFSFTQDKKVDESKVVTENKIASYKQIILNTYTYNGFCGLTEEQIDQKIQEYIDLEISSAKSKAKGMEFKEAFRLSLIISSICCVVFYLFYSMHDLHWAERRHRLLE